MNKSQFQAIHKAPGLNYLVHSKELLDNLHSLDATSKINSLFTYLRADPADDLADTTNLTRFLKRCVTREVVDKIKSNSGVEETDIEYKTRIAQEQYNTAKITNDIRLGLDDTGEVHFYVRFGKKKGKEWEVSTNDTLQIVGSVYKQFIVDLEDQEKALLDYALNESCSKKVAEDKNAKTEAADTKTELQNMKQENKKLQDNFNEISTKNVDLVKKVEALEMENKKLKEESVSRLEEENRKLKEDLVKKEEKVVDFGERLMVETTKNTEVMTKLNDSLKREVKLKADLEDATNVYKLQEAALKKAQDIQNTHDNYMKCLEDNLNEARNIANKREMTMAFLYDRIIKQDQEIVTLKSQLLCQNFDGDNEEEEEEEESNMNKSMVKSANKKQQAGQESYSPYQEMKAEIDAYIIEAAQLGETETIVDVYTQYGSQCLFAEGDGCTALEWAVKNRHNETAVKIIELQSKANK